MSAEKYLNKVVNRMEKEFQRRGYTENTYTIDSEILDRIPNLKITFNNLTYRFPLANEYISYMEDDISVKDSIKDRITEIFAEITRRMPVDIEAEEELDRDLNEEETEERDTEDDDPNRLYAVYEEEVKPYLRLFPVDYAERSNILMVAGGFWINKGDVIFRIGMEKDGEIKFVNGADVFPFNMEATKYIIRSDLINDAVNNYTDHSDILVRNQENDDGTLFLGIRKSDGSMDYSDYGASVIYNNNTMEMIKNTHGDFYALPVNKKTVLIVPFSVMREKSMTFEGLRDVLENTPSAIGHNILYYSEQEKNMKVASGREFEQQTENEQTQEEAEEREDDAGMTREEFETEILKVFQEKYPNAVFAVKQFTHETDDGEDKNIYLIDENIRSGVNLDEVWEEYEDQDNQNEGGSIHYHDFASVLQYIDGAYHNILDICLRNNLDTLENGPGNLDEETIDRLRREGDSIFGSGAGSSSEEQNVELLFEFRYFDTNSKDAFVDELVKFFQWKDPASEYVRAVNEEKQLYHGHDTVKNNTSGVEIETDHAWDIYEWCGFQQNHGSWRFVDTAEALYNFYIDKKPALIFSDEPYYINTLELSNSILPNEMDMIDVSNPEEAGEEEAQESASVVHFERNGRSDTEIAAEFEDFDTDYCMEFSEKLRQFFEWKLDRQAEPLDNVLFSGVYLNSNEFVGFGPLYRNHIFFSDNASYGSPALVINGWSVDVASYNDAYQSNNESFLQTATRAYDDYKANFLRSMMTEAESPGNGEGTNEGEFIEVDDDYLPFM